MDENIVRRARKAVNYADMTLGNSDDDDDFVSPKSSSQESVDKNTKSDNIKTTESSSGNDSRQTKERDSRKHEDKDKRHKKDKKKDKDRDRDKKKHKKDKHRNRDDRKDKNGSSRKDESRSRQDRDSERRRHSSDQKHKSLEDGRDEEVSDFREETSDSSRSCSSPRIPTTPSTSDVTPSRKGLKPRLTLEEKIFQREMEAALEISKLETSGDQSTPEKGASSAGKKGKMIVKKDTGSASNSASKLEISGDQSTPQKGASSAGEKGKMVDKQDSSLSRSGVSVASNSANTSPPAQIINNVESNPDAVTTPKLDKAESSDLHPESEEKPQILGNSSDIEEQRISNDSATASVNGHEDIKEVTNEGSSKKDFLGVVKLKINVNAGKCTLDDPVPSTSTGFTGKRQRKTVQFQEDSDSDSFTGFNAEDSLSDMSEGSDFHPSPKKKKKKTQGKGTKTKKNTKSNKSSSPPKPTDKTPERPKRQKSGPKSPISVKENTVPNSNVNGSSVTPHVPDTPVRPAVKSTAAKAPRVVVKVNSQPKKSVVSPSTVCTAARGGGGSIGLVKTPFKNPVLQSSGSINSTSTSPRSSSQATGLRLGLSRKTAKPLHPSVAGRIN